MRGHLALTGPITAAALSARLAVAPDDIGIALLRNWRPKAIALAQIALVLAYTAGLTLLAPALWLDPYGGLLKNLPILALLFAHLALVEER